MKPAEPVLKNIYQSNTCRKVFSWTHFGNEPRVPETQQVRDQQSCISVSVACLTIPNSNWGNQPRCDNSIPYMGIWYIYGDTEQPQEKETSQIGGSFSNRDNVRTPIQFRREGQPQHLKR